MRVQTLNETPHYTKILQLWNSEVEEPFLIREDLFESNVIKDKNVDYSLSKLIYQKDELVAFLLVKTAKENLFEAVMKQAWISLMHVKKAYRNQGIGTTLINDLIQSLKKRNIDTLLLGRDINNFLCGLPSSFGSEHFFLKRGFINTGTSHDMLRKISSHSYEPLRKKIEYEIDFLSKEDFSEMHRFLSESFRGRWTYEFEAYLKANGTGREFVVIKKDNRIIAFCRINDKQSPQNMHNTNWNNGLKELIGIGPLGVDERYRGHSLGYDITLYAVNEAIKRNAKEIIIDWTSHVSFYEKLGFESYQTYHSLEIDLKGE